MSRNRLYAIYMPSFDKYLACDTLGELTISWVDDLSEMESDSPQYYIVSDYNNFIDALDVVYHMLVRDNNMKITNFVNLHFVEVTIDIDVTFICDNSIPFASLSDEIAEAIR